MHSTFNNQKLFSSKQELQREGTLPKVPFLSAGPSSAILLFYGHMALFPRNNTEQRQQGSECDEEIPEGCHPGKPEADLNLRSGISVFFL